MKESRIFKYLVNYANGHEAVLWVLINYDPKETSLSEARERSQRVIDADKVYPHAMTSSHLVCDEPFNEGEQAKYGFILYERRIELLRRSPT